MRHAATLIALLPCLVAGLPAAQLASPDGKVVVTVNTVDDFGVTGVPVWTMTWQGRTVIAPGSRLGFTVKDGPVLNNHFTIAGETRREQDQTWQPVCGERSSIRDHYREMTLELKDAQGGPRRLTVTVRAYDTGAAIRYTIPAQPGLDRFTIDGETTSYAFDGDHLCWPIPTAQGDYMKEGQSPAPLSKVMPGAERPLTVRLAPDLWAALTEAGLVDSARMKFKPAAHNTLGTIIDGERGKAGVIAATAPFTSPWRAVLVASSAGGLLEANDLRLNLNEPCAIADTSWIKPGKVMRETTLTTVGAKATIDFCAARGIRYMLFDAGWYGHEYDDKADARAVNVDPKRNPNKGPLDMQEVVRYGNTRDVGVILYVNRRALERQLDELLPLYQSWGIKGVKYGFVQVGSQQWTSWLHMAIRKAAEHKLMIDIHDEFRSMGYERTYPNLMTVEGICGNEEFPSPAHNAALPFTRYLTGPADYTFCWMSTRLKPSQAHQLALTVLYYSPWQVLFWYDRPASVKGGPELEFWKHLPTTWDETKVLAGDPGTVAVIARRKGAEWYVGAIHPAGRTTLKVPLTFLAAGKAFDAAIHTDARPDDAAAKDVKTEARRVDATTVLELDIPAHGGAAIRIVPAP